MANNKSNEVIQNGLKTFYHSNSEKESEGKYKDNKKEGKWTFWNQDGKQIAQGSFKNGLKSGQWKENDRQSSYTGKYKNDKKEGKWIEIWLGEKKKEKYYSAGEITREIYYHNKDQKRDDKDYIKNHITWWYRNGQKQKEGGIKNKVLNGEWSYWYENGQTESKGSYKNGRETGHWNYWFDDGQIKAQGNYKDGRKDGQWTNWYENGQKSSKGNYKTRQYHCGMIHGEGTRKDGRPNMAVWLGDKEEQKDGEWTYWHANGLKAAEGTYGGDGSMSGGNLEKKITGKWPYGDSRAVTISINKVFGNQKNGKWHYWHPNGIKSREEKWSFIHVGRLSSPHIRSIEIAHRVGRIFSWHPNGQMALKGFYDEDGFYVTDWKRWYTDGRIKSITRYLNVDNDIFSYEIWDDQNRKLYAEYDSKVRSGVWTITNSNAKIKMKAYYPSLRGYDKPNKQLLPSPEKIDSHYDNGAIESECLFKDGKLNGLCKTWHGNGQLAAEASYKNGELVGKMKGWDGDGNEIKKPYAHFGSSTIDWAWTNENYVSIEKAIENHIKEDSLNDVDLLSTKLAFEFFNSNI